MAAFVPPFHSGFEGRHFLDFFAGGAAQKYGGRESGGAKSGGVALYIGVGALAGGAGDGLEMPWAEEPFCGFRGLNLVLVGCKERGSRMACLARLGVRGVPTGGGMEEEGGGMLGPG